MSTLEEIKERAEKATPGPWKVWGMQVLADPIGDSNVDTALPIADTTDPHRGLRTFNAEFIAHARTDVPKLLAALEAVEAVIAEHEARTPFPDANKESQWYSLGKQHGYERVRLEIKEALQ